jgi:DNA-directed RNA polymerase II subunit RPB1
MSAYKYDENIHHIDSIQFSVFSNDVVKDYSSVSKDEFGIYLPESYENSEPKRGGLVDTRLGITDLNLDCSYCGLKAKDCPGHFGHTELAEPVFHVGFFPIVKQILNCICLRSSRLLAHKYPEDLERVNRLYKGKKKFSEIRKLSSNVKISDVGVPVPKIKHEIKKGTGAITILAETNLGQVVDEEGEISNKPIIDVLNPSDVFNIFRNISNEDWRLLGFNPDLYRPEDLIISIFPVPPVAIRPSIRADFLASATYEDDLTHKLADIIKTNEKLRKQKEKELVSGEQSKYGNDLHNFLQYHVATYFENDKDSFLTSEQKVGGKKFKSISERLKGKPGRIRGNLMGKRVNFSARSVITSDPNLKLHELGIPRKVAMEITFPEVVTAYNIQRLTNLVRNGRYNYPGANFVIQGSSLGDNNIREYDLRYRKKTIKLRYGDIVERHLVNGDPVLFNRQPSLHKLSMMCHLANVIDDDRYNTFRLNVNVTPPYNADFDGDEMNMFAPQSIQTQTELFKIADVRRQIISPKDSKPIIGPVQDSVLGSYRMTQNNIKIDWHDYMNLVVFIRNNKNTQFNLDKNKFVKNKIYTGIDLFNNIIPNNINLEIGKVKLRNGYIVNGPIKKGINNRIISNCWDRHGHEITQTYIDNIQRIITNWLLLDGFSVGLGDCYINEKNKEIIVKELEKKKLEINHLITEIENNPELMDADLFEASLQSNLSAQKGEIQKLVQDNINSDNNFFIMVNSGSKGKAVNMMQIMGALGQDIFLFKRIQKAVNNRTLPHFFQDDDTPLARGFIEHSYLDGLTPQEFFFHHMSGREGLIDTAIKTADTGYISRRLMKGLEDVGVKYDGTVRTGNNIILQYIYSDFNLDQIKQRKQTLYTMKMGNDEIKLNYTLSKNEINELSKKHKIPENKISKKNNDYYVELLRLRDLLRHSQKMQYLNYRTIQSEFHLPINLTRIILDNINNIYADDKNEKINPLYIIEKIDEILDYNVTKLMCISEKNKESIKIKDESICKSLFKYLLYEYLSPKKIIYQHKLTKYKLDLIFQQIIDGFKDSQVVAGEMVGCLAAQHIGEPSTQMTLNTFHATGSGSVGMQGVPRIEELIRHSRNIKTPIMTIYLDKEFQHNKEKADIIASSIQYTTVKDIIDEYEIIYDINTNTSGYSLTDKVKNPFFANIKSSSKKYENMPWLLRIKLNRSSLINKNISLIDIKTSYIKFWKSFSSDLKGMKRQEKKIINSIVSSCILSNYDNSEYPIIHIRLDILEYDYNLLLEMCEWIINKFQLKGIENINKIQNIDYALKVTFENETNKFEETNEWLIITEGINMLNIRTLNGIDLNRTYCNDIQSIYKYFGIEAARSAVLKELNMVYGSSDVNYHHLSILVDVMTNNGRLTSIDRHGISKLDTDPLSRASFEMPIEHLIKAAMFCEVDHMRSVSSRIMAGRVISGGSGLCDVLLDVDMIQNSEYIEDIESIHRSNFIGFEKNSIIDDIMTRQIMEIFKPTSK